MFEGRAIAGPNAYDQIPGLAERGMLRADHLEALPGSSWLLRSAASLLLGRKPKRCPGLCR